MKTEKRKGRLLVSLMCVLSVPLIFSCSSNTSDTSELDRKIQRTQQAADACTQKGGIPFYSVWDPNMLTDCKFPPEKR